MLSEEQAQQTEQVIGLSTLQKICRLLGHEPERTISISIDTHYVHTDFITSDGKRAVESLEVRREK